MLRNSRFVNTMINMSTQTSTFDAQGIPSGFGQRLKEERKRLKFSQESFATIGGVKRLAQLQYESEASTPTVRYLSAIGAAGVDLSYLLFGMKTQSGTISPEKQEQIESRAFEWVEECANARQDGKLSAEMRRFLYQMIKGVLIQIELGKYPANFDIDLLKTQQIASLGKG